MIYENTGFDLDKNMKLREAARSIDTESRAAGIEALKPLERKILPASLQPYMNHDLTILLDFSKSST